MTKPIQVKNMSLGEGIPKICVPITGKTEEEIKEEGKKQWKQVQSLWNGEPIFLKRLRTGQL